MARSETQIREAAESLLHASPRNSYAHSNFMRSPEIILSSDLTAGSRHHGKMSDVRRSFCLLVTFDLLFTSLMWLICTMIAGEDMNTAFIDQIVHYRVETSLFDIVMAAICRFTVLLLFYALLYMNHWIIIALSTAGTCIFLIAKVFLFDWKRYDQPVFQVLLILSSFILAWAEALLFDLRVIPQETQARDWFRSFTDTERSPLQQSASGVPQYRSTDVVNTFFTPVDSPNLSDTEDNCSRRNSRSSSRSSIMFPSHPLPPPTKKKMEEYKRISSTLLRNSHDLLTSTAWKVMTVTSDGDIVSFMQLPKPEGKILKITGTINKSAKSVVDYLYDAIEQSPRWNKCVMESFVLQEIDENSDIVYQSTHPQGGGIIGSRDFIILRRRGKYGNFHMSSGISVILDSVPARKNYVRGENGVGCWAAEDISEGKSRFTWIVNTNLKGWLPQQIVDMAMSSVMLDFIKQFRKHLYETHVAVA